MGREGPICAVPFLFLARVKRSLCSPAGASRFSECGLEVSLACEGIPLPGVVTLSHLARRGLGAFRFDCSILCGATRWWEIYSFSCSHATRHSELLSLIALFASFSLAPRIRKNLPHSCSSVSIQILAPFNSIIPRLLASWVSGNLPFCGYQDVISVLRVAYWCQLTSSRL